MRLTSSAHSLAPTSIAPNGRTAPAALGFIAVFYHWAMMVLAGAGLVFFFMAALWAYYHLVKQHYGFMVLYKKKNNDLAPIDNALDRLLLLFAFNYPFVAFIAQDAEAMARVPVALQSGRYSALATVLLIGDDRAGCCLAGGSYNARSSARR